MHSGFQKLRLHHEHITDALNLPHFAPQRKIWKHKGFDDAYDQLQVTAVPSHHLQEKPKAWVARRAEMMQKWNLSFFSKSQPGQYETGTAVVPTNVEILTGPNLQWCSPTDISPKNPLFLSESYPSKKMSPTLRSDDDHLMGSRYWLRGLRPWNIELSNAFSHRCSADWTTSDLNRSSVDGQWWTVANIKISYNAVTSRAVPTNVKYNYVIVMLWFL